MYSVVYGLSLSVVPAVGVLSGLPQYTSAVSSVVVGVRIVWSCVDLVCLPVGLYVSLLCRGPVRVLFV